jgi:hypothetical protein
MTLNFQTEPNSLLVNNTNILDSFAILLEWLSQAHLQNSIDFNLPFAGDALTIEKCHKVLPLLVEIIIGLNNSSTSAEFNKYHLVFLEFLYWSLLHCDGAYQNQVRIDNRQNFFT